MDPEQNNLESQEELNAENETLEEAKADESKLREKLAEELGLDPESQAEILDRVVKIKQADHQKLSKAIDQKRKWRDEAKKTAKTPQSNARNTGTPDITTLVNEEVSKRLEARDLESLGLPDELASEVQKLAKMNGVSVREAAKDPYIQYKKTELEREARITAATPKRKGTAGYVSAVDPSKPLNLAEFNFNTEEGRKAYEVAKEARRKYEADHKS